MSPNQIDLPTCLAMCLCTHIIHCKCCRISKRGFHFGICTCRRTGLLPILQFNSQPTKAEGAIIDAFFEICAIDEGTDPIRNAMNSLIDLIQSLEIHHRTSPNCLRKESFGLMVREQFLVLNYQITKAPHRFVKPWTPSPEHAFMIALTQKSKHGSFSHAGFTRMMGFPDRFEMDSQAGLHLKSRSDDSRGSNSRRGQSHFQCLTRIFMT
jgi:hypothetical protein